LRLEKVRILNLLEISHFGWGEKTNVYVKMLLSCVHGGEIWLDPFVSIDTALIACITGLPKDGEDPGILFNKVEEQALFESMKDKFDTFRGKRGLDVKRINNKNVRFVT